MGMNPIGGLASGMDTYQIIQDLMKAHRKPVDKLRQQRQILEWRREDYRALNSSLLHFRSNAVFPMRLGTTFSAKSVESSNAFVVTASAPPTAANTTYNVEVVSLATTAYRSSTADISEGGGTLDPDQTLVSQYEKLNPAWNPESDTEFSFTLTTHNYDGEAQSKTFTVDATETSLNQLLSEINNSGLGLTAFYDSTADRVSISTTRTGNNNAGGDEILIADDPTGFLTQALKLGGESGGANAAVTINGMNIERAANDFTLNNVNFSLKAEGTSTITVGSDTEAVFQQIKNFVAEYNSILEKINGKLFEERFRDYLPLMDDDKEGLTDRQIDQWQDKARSGLLRHDTILGGVVSRMRDEVFTAVEGLDTDLNHLAHIGITVGSFGDRGKLVIDETKLRSAIEQNPEGVAQIFSKRGDTTAEQGIAQRLYSSLDTAIKQVTAQAGSATSPVLNDQSWIGRQISDIDERVGRAEQRLEKMEDRYWNQFAAMERAINQMNAQSMWLAQQMGGGMAY